MIDPKQAQVGDKFKMTITGFTEIYEGEVIYINANKLPVMKVLGEDAGSWPVLKNGDYILKEKI